MTPLKKIETLKAEHEALIERRNLALASLEGLGTRERGALNAARRAYSDALVDGDAAAVKRAAGEMEKAKAALDAATREEERVSLLAEGLMTKIENTKRQIDAADAERVDGLRAWLNAVASRAAGEYLAAIEAARAAGTRLYAIAPLLQYEAGCQDIARQNPAYAVAPVFNMSEFASLDDVFRDNPFKILESDVKAERSAFRAEAQERGLMVKPVASSTGGLVPVDCINEA